MKWMMNFAHLCSLQKPIHQQHCLTFKPFALRFPYLTKALNFFHTSSQFIHGLQSTHISKTSQSSNLYFRPTSNFFSKLLSECTEFKVLGLGKETHARIFRLGLSKDPKVRNHLVNCYAKCGAFGYARKLVDESTEPDLVSWSALISGFVQNGFGREAISAFCDMHLLGVKCNEFTFPSVLKACIVTKNLWLGKQVHGTAVVTGFEIDEFVANSLVVLYAKFGEYVESRRIFYGMPNQGIVSWNALLSSYAQSDLFKEAVELFQDMVLSGVRPNEFSLSTMINACTGFEDSSQGRKIHGYLIKLGYNSDQFSVNALIDMYAKVGTLEEAVSIFEEIAKPDIVSWNAIIAGCVLLEDHHLALELFRKMNSSGMLPNLFTLSSALKACAIMGLSESGKQLHSCLVKIDTGSDSFVRVGLIDMYCKSNLMDDANLVFKLMIEKDMIAWNAMISGYSQNGKDLEAVSLFPLMYREGVGFNQTTTSTVLKSIAGLQDHHICGQIHALCVKSGMEYDNYVVNSLIDTYGKCGHVENATRVFKESPIVDLVAFTSMITAYAQDGQGEEALKLYSEMQARGIKADSFVCSSLLNACANLSAYEQGKQVHIHVLKLGFMSDKFAGNSLVNMYAKCGSIDDADCAFHEIPERGIVSWSAMIAGLAQHGHGKEALDFFSRMLKDDVPPNHITLVSVLCACNHAGLVDDAKHYFISMEQLFGIEPMQEHYACMIDILGRAGKLDEAMDLVNRMPFKANASVWGALLGAARIHKNVELGRQAAEMLFALEPEKSGTHVLLANIYAAAGMWTDVANVRRLMKDSKVKKEPGMSWMEIKDKVHTFIVGDRSHLRSKEIYAKLDELSDRLNKAGYVPMVEIDLHDVEQSEKERLLYHHSEKLAVAFGLIATPTGAPIRVKKNLRICLDCHTFFKFVCKIVSREIIVRDINRFHRFRDGSCSCGDYW